MIELLAAVDNKQTDSWPEDLLLAPSLTAETMTCPCPITSTDTTVPALHGMPIGEGVYHLPTGPLAMAGGGLEEGAPTVHRTVCGMGCGCRLTHGSVP